MIELFYGDRKYKFGLDLKRMAEFERNCDIGIPAFYISLRSLIYYRATHLEEFLRLSLIAGGTEPEAARTVLDDYFLAVDLHVSRAIAAAVIEQAFGPIVPDDEDERETVAA